MSTRSAIIHKTATGYAGVYCHSDGYLEYTGAMLQEHYTQPEKVAALIALGDLSILGPNVAPKGAHSFEYNEREPGVTVAYHRDRGEELNISTGATVDEVAEQIGHNGYVYVFDGAGWTCNGEQFRVAPEDRVSA